MNYKIELKQDTWFAVIWEYDATGKLLYMMTKKFPTRAEAKVEVRAFKIINELVA